MQGGAPNVPPQMNKKSGNTSVLPLLYLFTVTSYVGMIQIRYTGPDGVSQISARFRRLPGTYFLFSLLFTIRQGREDVKFSSYTVTLIYV